MPDVNGPAQGIGSLHERLDRIEHLVTETCMHPAERIHLHVGVPAWKRRTEGEARWQVAVCTAVAIALQIGPRCGERRARRHRRPAGRRCMPGRMQSALASPDISNL